MPLKIAYVGFGELGKQIAMFIRQTHNDIEEEIFFDDILASKKSKNAFPFSSFKEEKFNAFEFFVCLGYKQPEAKSAVIRELITLNRKLATYIHPTAIINPEARVNAGTIIYPGCNIDQHVVIESGVLLNNSVTVSHNSVIGEASFLAPGVTICGNVNVGSRTFIGSGSVISNDVNIGDDVIAGAGTIITQDIAAGSSVIGNPFRILSKKLNLK